MKKPLKIARKKNAPKDGKSIQLSEPLIPNKFIRALPEVKDFNYSEFKKLADKSAFTQAEWAAILHLSERTLQRYAKSNSNFAPINAERALQIEKVLKEGKLAFGSGLNFYNWLKRNPAMLEGTLSIESLNSFDGIEKVLIQLGRIQHGLFA